MSKQAWTATSFAASQETLEAEAVRTAQQSSDIARAQLQAGTVDIVTVLNTETTLFNDQDHAGTGARDALPSRWSRSTRPWGAAGRCQAKRGEGRS